MTEQKGPFRVGQEVQVSYRARVAEVSTGSSEEAAAILRLEPMDGSYNSPPGGWVDPAVVVVEVVNEPLPSKPGVYWGPTLQPEQQMIPRNGHTDGKRFFYLNAEGTWVDLGFGHPTADDARWLSGPLVEVPF